MEAPHSAFVLPATQTPSVRVVRAVALEIRNGTRYSRFSVNSVNARDFMGVCVGRGPLCRYACELDVAISRQTCGRGEATNIRGLRWVALVAAMVAALLVWRAVSLTNHSTRRLLNSRVDCLTTHQPLLPPPITVSVRRTPSGISLAGASSLWPQKRELAVYEIPVQPAAVAVWGTHVTQLRVCLAHYGRLIGTVRLQADRFTWSGPTRRSARTGQVVLIPMGTDTYVLSAPINRRSH